jgi:hypothetical protein
VVPTASSFLSRRSAHRDTGDEGDAQGRIDAHRCSGPEGRWFKSSRPDLATKHSAQEPLLLSRESGSDVGCPIHGYTGSAVAGGSRCGDEELVEPVDEAWRRSDEVPGTGRDQPLGIEDCGERVADPLQPWSVTARGHQRGDARVPY